MTVSADDGHKELVVDAARGLRVLTNNPDELTKEADRSLVVADIILGAVFCRLPLDTSTEAIAAKLQELRDSRNRDSGGSPYLVVTLSGEVPDLIPTHQQETDDYVVCFDGPSRAEVRDAAEPLATAVIAAVKLAVEPLVGVKKLSDRVVFFRDDGKPIYAYSFSGSASGLVSYPFPGDSIAAIARWYSKLVGDTSMARVIRLLASSYESEGDKLRSFLGAWTALEIFVNKVFGLYETKLFHELRSDDRPAVHGQYLDRIRAVMKDKYRIFDKFAVLACQLSPEDADADVVRFKAAKDLRDDMAHGQDVIETALPVESVQTLLRKYLRLHLA